MNIPQSLKQKIFTEPRLEVLAVNWKPAYRRYMAAVFARWARQLRVTARAMETQDGKPIRRRKLKPGRNAKWN